MTQVAARSRYAGTAGRDSRVMMLSAPRLSAAARRPESSPANRFTVPSAATSSIALTWSEKLPNPGARPVGAGRDRGRDRLGIDVALVGQCEAAPGERGTQRGDPGPGVGGDPLLAFGDIDDPGEVSEIEQYPVAGAQGGGGGPGAGGLDRVRPPCDSTGSLTSSTSTGPGPGPSPAKLTSHFPG
jgi:hypothetical protein